MREKQKRTEELHIEDITIGGCLTRMSSKLHFKMEDTEEKELLGEEEETGEHDADVGGAVETAAEELMTDMKLEDDIDEVRGKEPDFSWSYHIEIYPWNADDMTENFVRLIKLAQFSQIFMKKKGIGKDNDGTEKIDDKLPGRQRKGCLHLYTDTWQNAKNIMRSATWKTMTAKQLTFEITKCGPAVGKMESAYLELDTYSASKTRFRDKAKGELKHRSAKVSNLPGTISREFLDVVFSRAYAVIGGATVKEYLKEREGKLQQKLLDLKDFSGSIDFDCLGRGSCRAFVLAHKSVFIEGQTVDIVANDKETMIVPPNTQDIGVKEKQEADLTTITPTLSSQSGRGRGTRGLHAHGNSLPMRRPTCDFNPSNGRGFIKSNNLHIGRGCGLGRAMIQLPRPVSVPFTRVGPGMLVPMTGRQKMNEKMRRNNFGVTTGASVCGGGMYAIAGGLMGTRAPIQGSIGNSFKQEIASLQSQLERNTQELEAKIEILKQTTHSGSHFEGDMTDFQDGDWNRGDFDCRDEFSHEDYYVHTDGSYATDEMQNFHFETQPPGQHTRTNACIQMGNVGHLTSPTIHQSIPWGVPVPEMRGITRGMRPGRMNAHGNMSRYW